MQHESVLTNTNTMVTRSTNTSGYSSWPLWTEDCLQEMEETSQVLPVSEPEGRSDSPSQEARGQAVKHSQV